MITIQRCLCIMLNTTNHRLKFFVDSLHVSKTEFAVEIGTSQPAMSAILSGQRPLSRGMIARIKERYPKLNVVWLQTGEGDMVVNTQNGSVNQYVGGDGNNYNNSPVFGKVEEEETDINIIELSENSAPEDLMNEIYRLRATLFSKDEEIKKLKRGLTDKKKEIKTLKSILK